MTETARSNIDFAAFCLRAFFRDEDSEEAETGSHLVADVLLHARLFLRGKK